MRYNIHLGFDAATESAVNALRAQIYEKTLRARLPPRMPPHLSLLVFDEVDSAKVTQKFKQFADAAAPFDVDLYTTDSFRGNTTTTLFVKPRPSAELKDSFLRCFTLFSDSLLLPPYSSFQKWQPHVTLMKLDTKSGGAKAEAQAEESWKARTGRIRRVGLINVQKPLEVLAERVF